MLLVNAEFLERVVRGGPLALARLRAIDGSANPAPRTSWDRLSTWALICEEILDTEQPAGWYDAILAELRRRGFDFTQIDHMRRFAWATAGWLNFDRMMWESCSLDASDIKLALDWQRQEGLITRTQFEAALSIIEHPDRATPCWPQASPVDEAD